MTVDRIKDATDGLGAMAVLEMVGIDATLTMAVQCLRKMGRVVMVGIGSGTYPLGYTSILNENPGKAGRYARI